MNEDSIKKSFIKRVEGDFLILEEVEGYHDFYKQGVRIDFMLKPRSHLVKDGFIDEWFGVEAKWIKGHGGMTSKTTRLIWQSITYAQSRFNVEGSWHVPSFVAILTPDSIERSIEDLTNKLLGLAHYGNVGRFFFYKHGGWGIKFAYNYATTSEDGLECYVNDKQLPKRRAGSV